MRRLALLLPVFLLLVTVVHAETYTFTPESGSQNQYLLNYYAKQGSCYDFNSQYYQTQSACQGQQQYAQSNGNTVLEACSQISDSSYSYSLPGPACSDSLSAYNLKLVGTGSTGTNGGTAGSVCPTGMHDELDGNGCVPDTPTNNATNGTNGTNGTGSSGDCGGALCNPLNNIHSLPDLLDTILKAIVELGAILLAVMLVYVGFLFVSAQGNAEKLSTARNALMWTVIGGLILLGAEAISQVIQATVKSL